MIVFVALLVSLMVVVYVKNSRLFDSHFVIVFVDDPVTLDHKLATTAIQAYKRTYNVIQ